MEVDGQKYLTTVGVIEKLPAEMLLEWDLPVLFNLPSKDKSLGNAQESVTEMKRNVSCFVMTRSLV